MYRWLDIANCKVPVSSYAPSMTYTYTGYRYTTPRTGNKNRRVRIYYCYLVTLRSVLFHSRQQRPDVRSAAARLSPERALSEPRTTPRGRERKKAKQTDNNNNPHKRASLHWPRGTWGWVEAEDPDEGELPRVTPSYQTDRESREWEGKGKKGTKEGVIGEPTQTEEGKRILY